MNKATICLGKNNNGTRCSKKTKNEEGYCHLHISQFEESFHEEKPSTCPVCLEDMTDNRPLECGHWIHMTCIEKSLKPECPICRAELDLPDTILKSIEKNAREMRKEWEEQEEAELRENDDITENLIHSMLVNYVFDVVRRNFMCENCSSANSDGEEIMVIFEVF